MWGIIFHEMGHGFTSLMGGMDWDGMGSTVPMFIELMDYDNGATSFSFALSEGLATATGMWAAERLISRAAELRLPPHIVDSLNRSWLCWRVGVGGALASYISRGADFGQLDPDVLDDLIHDLTGTYGWSWLYRFFSVLLGDGDDLIPVTVDGIEQQATFFAAAASAASGVDLRARFESELGFPIDASLYGTILPRLVPLARQRDPAVDAGSDRLAAMGERVRIEDSFAIDWEGDPLTFQWVVTESPAHAMPVLTLSDTLHPEFMADAPGTYVLRLTASDGLLDAVPDTLRVEVTRSSPRRPSGRLAPLP
jgi:hypothetical protein